MADGRWVEGQMGGWELACVVTRSSSVDVAAGAARGIQGILAQYSTSYTAQCGPCFCFTCHLQGSNASARGTARGNNTAAIRASLGSRFAGDINRSRLTSLPPTTWPR